MIKRWFHRRNLPHLYYNSGEYFITYRLYNSIPRALLPKIKSPDEHDSRIFRRYEKILEQGNYGEKYLLDPVIAGICKDTIHYPDGKDYKLICYCIMPNHVHLVFDLFEDKKPIDKLMQSIKRISALRCNEYLNRSGFFWQDESYDRLIRDDKEMYYVIRYVLNNPVKAGLVDSWEKWQNTYCRPEYVVI